MFKEIGLQKIITALAVIAAIGALIVFSGLVKVGNKASEATGTIVVWGTIPRKIMDPYMEISQTKTLKIQYEAQDPETYESDLINAFAAGEGPDLFIMPHEYLLRHSNKVFEIPYTSLPADTYQANYIDEADLFLSPTGVKALPVLVDPLIMYYNKSLMSSAFILEVPKYWDEVLDFGKKVTIANTNGEISISGVAMGTYDNILGAKDIISALIMQNGNPIVQTNTQTTKKQSSITSSPENAKAAEDAINFYTSFARSRNTNYSWNEALVESRDKFIAGDLGIYFGRASELETIQRKNPNLDFNIALLPQVRDTKRKLTHGKMTGIAISKQTKNIAGAINVASKIAGFDVAAGLAKDLSVAPARKDLLTNKPDNAQETLFYNSAIIAEGWIDADPDMTEELFKKMIRDINTGVGTIPDVLQGMHTEMDVILNRTINTTLIDPTLNI